MGAKTKKSHGNLHPKQYEIVKTRANVGNSLTLADGTKVPLARVGATVVKDPGLARAIDQEFGRQKRARRNGDVLVIETDNNHLNERENQGHTYTFTVPALPWHRYDKNGRRIR